MRKKQPTEKKAESTDLGILNMQAIEPQQLDVDLDIGIYKIYTSVETPFYATESSACFDVKAYLGLEVEKVASYNRLLIATKKRVVVIPEIGKRGVYIEPGECLYIPTGYILDIPEGYQIRYYPRSGISSQKHLKLANAVGIIDADFVHENMILMFNDSEMRQVIGHGDKIAQGEILPVLRTGFTQLSTIPGKKTSRSGGMGHTRGIRNALVLLT